LPARKRLANTNVPAMQTDTQPVTIVGAGMAGCEAAVRLARMGLDVELVEMKPAAYSPAHRLPGPAELVCSNSLKSDDPLTAHGLLKSEMRKLGSVILEAAALTNVPAGTALAVDRVAFSEAVRGIIEAEPKINFTPGIEMSDLPAGDVIVASGPLTSGPLATVLQRFCPDNDLYFYDALAPIVEAESIDRLKVFEGSRWGKGGGDYLNCPLSEDQYRVFVDALRRAPCTPLHEFEQTDFFEGCLPIEELARRGDETLSFGPLRPVGFEIKPRPFAVVQLRRENRSGSAYNMVGFQTKMTQAGQREVFRLIPGLADVKFLRYGAIHRNFYVNAPRVLNDTFGLLAEPRIRLSGQIVGVEGYVESAAMGILAGLFMARQRAAKGITPPPLTTAMGALYAHVRGSGLSKSFEPMNINFGLLPETGARGRVNRRKAAVERAERDLAAWLLTLEES
jgi:methylenetetrahydrofolate--tRNA-(uracil-5-)-methyltransferase